MQDKKLEQIKQILKETDVTGLINGSGAPQDEYDHEALMIYERTYRLDSVEKIQQKCWDVFYSQFCIYYSEDGTVRKDNLERARESIGDVEEYREIAQKIKLVIGA